MNERIGSELKWDTVRKIAYKEKKRCNFNTRRLIKVINMSNISLYHLVQNE